MSGKLLVRDIKDPPMDIMSPPPPSDIILLELISLKRVEWSPELPREGILRIHPWTSCHHR